MLEQAVIDAASLKEAAMKNAESIILEKYSAELKEAVDSILDQPDLNQDPFGSGSELPPTEDPLAKNIPMAATNGENACPCPDEDEEIEINFDQLAQQMDQTNQSSPNDDFGLPGQTGELEPSFNENMLEEEVDGIQVPPQLAPELHMYHMSMDDPIYKVGSLAYIGKPVPSDLVQQAIDNLESMVGKMGDPDENQKVEELVNQLRDVLSSTTQNQSSTMEGEYNQNLYEEFNEESLNDLMEMLTTQNESLEVDIEAVPHGHAGHATSSERINADQIVLAKTQDDKVSEENKNIKKALEKLQETNKNLEKSNKLLNENINSINLEYNKIKGITLKASEKLQEINLENAKLIYMNRALRNDSLNERQKNTIVENIFKVDSVNEAKVLYETVLDSSKANAKAPETLTEALDFNRGRLLSFKSGRTTNETDPRKERMQTLAGIKK